MYIKTSTNYHECYESTYNYLIDMSIHHYLELKIIKLFYVLCSEKYLSSLLITYFIKRASAQKYVELKISQP